jgi:hypothetical protein
MPIDCVSTHIKTRRRLQISGLAGQGAAAPWLSHKGNNLAQVLNLMTRSLMLCLCMPPHVDTCHSKRFAHVSAAVIYNHGNPCSQSLRLAAGADTAPQRIAWHNGTQQEKGGKRRARGEAGTLEQQRRSDFLQLPFQIVHICLVELSL